MIESPDPGMLKSLAEADGWVAVYALPQMPFIKVLPLVKWGLLLQDKTQKIVGYVSDDAPSAVRVGGMLRDGALFVSYYRPTGIAEYDAQTFGDLWRSTTDLGQRLAAINDNEEEMSNE